jgi:hypothetical protein
VQDDIATTTGNSAESDSPDITDLGHDVFQIDTKMADTRASRPAT